MHSSALIAIAIHLCFHLANSASFCDILQPLSLLLKGSPLIDELALYDVVNTPGVAADLSHISSPAVSSQLPAPSSQLHRPRGLPTLRIADSHLASFPLARLPLQLQLTNAAVFLIESDWLPARQ